MDIWGDLKKGFNTVVAFGDKNAPQIMTGAGLVVNLAAFYFFWKKMRAAEHTIGVKEAEIQAEVAPDKNVLGTMEGRVQLPKKEKLSIYLQYCWMPLLLELIANGLIIGGQKLLFDRLATMYLLTQFLDKKGEGKDKYIEKLKEKVGWKEDTKLDLELENDLVEDEYTEEDVRELAKHAIGEGDLLVVDEETAHAWWDHTSNLTEGFAEFGKLLVEKRNEQLERRMNTLKSPYSLERKKMEKDPFYYSDDIHPAFDDDDVPWGDDVFGDVYSAEPLGTLLSYINDPYTHMGCYFNMQDIVEFRCNSNKPPFRLKDVMKFKTYGSIEKGNKIDVCFLTYKDYLSASSELMDRSPV